MRISVLARSILGTAFVALLVIFATMTIGWIRIKNRAQIDAHHSRLLEEDFDRSFPYCYSHRRGKARDNFRFLIPASSEKETIIDVFNRALIGSASLRIMDEDGRCIFAEQGRTIDVRKHIKLRAGEYTMNIDLGSVYDGEFEIGLKGNLVWITDLNPQRFSKVEPHCGRKYRWPYLLYVPQKTADRPILLVVPNNTGFVDDWQRIHEESAKNEISIRAELADAIGAALMVPIFPRRARQGEIYTQALSRSTLTCDCGDISRLDLQIADMMEDAIDRLRSQNVAVRSKVLLFGFSASGMFVNRFTMLHPDRVAGLACGSPGGWPIAPVPEFQGKKLRYPVGIEDVQDLTHLNLNLEAIRRVPMFMFLGASDTNDSVVYHDSYEEEDERLIGGLFGCNLQERWKAAEALYRRAGLNCQFVLYPSAGHDITRPMIDDITKFFQECMKKE